MLRKMLILYCLLSLLACEKKPEGEITPPPPGINNNEDTSKLELVWSFPLGNDASCMDPLYHNNHVLFSSSKLDASSVVLLYLNAETGEPEWQWKGFLTNTDLIDENDYDIFQNKFCYGGGKETGVIDLNSGQTVWQDQARCSPRVVVIDGFVYRKQVSEELHTPYVHLIRSPISNPKWDTLFTIYSDSIDGYTPSIEGPSLWMAPGGDSVLVFQLRSWHFGNSDGRIDFYAYNLSQQKVQFVLEDIDPSGNSNVVAPLVNGNYAYFLGARSISCIDLIKGETVWQKLFYGNGAQSFSSNLLVIDNKLIVKQDNGYLTAFDKLTGNVIWQQTEAGTTPSHMKYYDGIIYYTSEGKGKLMAIDATDGGIIWAEASPHEEKNSNAFFHGGVAINPDKGYIYAHDYYYAMCFKLPKK